MIFFKSYHVEKYDSPGDTKSSVVGLDVVHVVYHRSPCEDVALFFFGEGGTIYPIENFKGGGVGTRNLEAEGLSPGQYFLTQCL